MTMHFDNQAKDWDKDSTKRKRAIIFAEEIKNFIQLSPHLNALEFGCGTGLLSFQLKDSFKTITLTDNSAEMIKVLKEKIDKENIHNFQPQLINSFKNDLKTNEYDVIYTLMTLHHIPNINSILKTFHSSLKKEGYLCIADLVKEDGSFHSQYKNFNGHNGFDKKELSILLSNNGFNLEYYKICFEAEKKIDDKILKYPLFLMICKKIA